jgi:hypothetical protein
MKLRSFVALGMGLLLAGCASAPESDSYTHRAAFAGPDMDITLDNLIESNEDKAYLIWLNAVRIRDSAWEARYYLEVRYEGASDAGYIDIPPGETLLVTVDGQILRFRGIGSDATREQTGRGTFVENALYEAKAEVIKQIAKAKDVKVQVNGTKRKLYREFKPVNTQKFRNFALTHMGGL